MAVADILSDYPQILFFVVGGGLLIDAQIGAIAKVLNLSVGAILGNPNLMSPADPFLIFFCLSIFSLMIWFISLRG